MNILIIGSGGREHALAYALFHSNSCSKIYAAPGNPGIAQYGENVNLSLDNFDDVTRFCNNYSIDLVVVGPEKPLADGIVDYLQSFGINVFGPNKFAAQLESSKAFAKNFMHKYNIPTADYEVFDINSKDEAFNFIENVKEYPIVLKADGLAAGKGVVICKDFETAKTELQEYFEGKFGEAGKRIVIEKFMEGEEASILAICDGTNYITLASSQDHKRAFDNDEGPNTGGMGAYSPAPIVNDEILEKIKSNIIEPTLNGMRKEGSLFKGCLYCGLMIKDNNVKVVEYNVRFGDPETQAVLMNFRGDFAALLHSAANGHLDYSYIDEVCYSNSCCVVMVSKGYPGKYEKGQIITGIKEAENDGAIVFHAGTKLDSGNLIVNGGRVLGVTATGKTLKDAVELAYKSISKIHFNNSYWRKDIAKKAL